MRTYHVVSGQEGIVHSDNFDVRVASESGAEHQTPNATEAVDSNLNLTHIEAAQETSVGRTSELNFRLAF
jgi:hypothetical protein